MSAGVRAPYSRTTLAELVALRKQLVQSRAQRRQPDAARHDHHVAPRRCSTGQLLPNGPRTPSTSPGFSLRIALGHRCPPRGWCGPGLPAAAGSPLIEIGTSPTPKTYSMLNCPAERSRRPERDRLELQRERVGRLAA